MPKLSVSRKFLFDISFAQLTPQPLNPSAPYAMPSPKSSKHEEMRVEGGERGASGFSMDSKKKRGGQSENEA